MRWPRNAILSSPIAQLTKLSLALLFLASCAHQPTTCQELDWYEIGRQDGSNIQNGKGRRTIAPTCEDSDTSLSEALYNNGFDSSIAQYCTPQNGYELGLTKQISKEDLCPPLLRDEFAISYKQGLRANQIKSEQQHISNKLETLDIALGDKSIEIVKRGLLSGEKIELLEKTKALDTELENILKAQAKN